MSSLLKTSSAGIIVAAIAAVGLAQQPVPKPAVTPPPPPTPKSVFQKMDRNANGKVTAGEHQIRLQEWFKEMDKNGDGKLSPDEYSALHFLEADIDQDGKVTLEEYLVFFAGKNAPAPADPKAEAATLYPKDAQEFTRTEVVLYRKSVFKAINTSGSGKVTPEEMKVYDSKEFAVLDKNQDGVITKDEIGAYLSMSVCGSQKEGK